MKNKIFVNQIGYGVDLQKFAYVKGFSQGTEFKIINSDGKSVYTGSLTNERTDEISGETTCVADFSDFSFDGQFFLQIHDVKSSLFKIGSSVFNDLYFSTLRYFYLSRCGQEIKDSVFHHSECHTSDAKIFGTELTKNVNGGWHDAGDYGRYIVAGSKAVMDLLLAYLSCKSYSDFDILDEVRFELDWFLKMQREDGAVYHKVSCYNFCSFIMPEEEKDELVIAPVSTAATADFAGCLAFASLVFKEKDSVYSEKLLQASLKAQHYVDSNKDELYKNPSEITTGSYSDWNVYDEKFFALSALYIVTKDDVYLKKALEIRKIAKSKKDDKNVEWKKNWFVSFGWGCVSGYGYELLLKNKDLLSSQVYDELLKDILENAERILSFVKESSFDVGVKMVFWGSNGFVCDEAHILLLAYELSGKKEYYDAALMQLNYILGCNPMDMCYVTGNGTNSPKHCHHRPSGAINKIMSGMLSGGPCSGLYDSVAKEKLQGVAPLKCFVDIQGSYSTNEVAIYWNSSLVHLISRLKLI